MKQKFQIGDIVLDVWGFSLKKYNRGVVVGFENIPSHPH